MTHDENRIPTHSHDKSDLSFNKAKPECWTYESHTLHVTQSSYLYNFDFPKTQTPYQSLISLAECISKKHTIHITVDKYFGNVEQAEKLTEKGLFFTFNYKANSKPTILWKGDLARGLPKFRSRFARKGLLVTAVFHSKSKLHFLSNFFQVVEIPNSDRAERGKMIQYYDNTKRRGDQFNQLVANFHNPHLHKQGKHSLFHRWIEWDFTNGFILYKLNTKQPLTHRHYLQYLSAYLLS
jgi:hypothetical protein